METVELLLQGKCHGFYATLKVFKFINGLKPKIRNKKDINLYARTLAKYVNDGLHSTTNFRLEDKKVYRLELIESTRIIGFFDGNDFIAVDWYEKKKQKNDQRMNSAIAKANLIAENKTWKKGDIL